MTMTATEYRRTVAIREAGRMTDRELAENARQAMRDLAQHAPEYVTALDHCPGARLSGMIVTGYVEYASPKGRAALRLLYVKAQTALTIPPGLDRNEFIDALTGRENPRLAHLRAEADRRMRH